MNRYIFTSTRLGFRTWRESDISRMVEINNDDEVMAFFPNKPSEADTLLFIEQMQNIFNRRGFCYFAVDTLQSGDFIGFIGLSEKTFKSDFTPCVDIGWRLKKNVWNKGFATEGALACLDFGFNTICLEKICAIAPVVNVKSEFVMKKIGMKKVRTFEHPQLSKYPLLKECVLYEIST